MQRPVRLPLQVGFAGIAETARYAAFIWLGPTLLIATAMFAPLFPMALRVVWILVVGLSSIFAMAIAAEAADRAGRDRPSDALLDAQGLTLETADGARKLAWSDVDASSCAVAPGEPRLAVRWAILSWLTFRRVPWLVARERVDVHRLRITHRADGEVELAEGEGAEELESLEALRDAIRSAAPSDEAPEPEVAPDVVRCPGCGAAQIPVDAPSAPCPFCGHAVSFSDELRAKLRATTELEANDPGPRVIEQLLDQPGAERAARLLWIGRKILVWMQPIVFVYFIVVCWRQTTERPSAADGIFVRRVTPSDDFVFFWDIVVLLAAIVALFPIVWSLLAAYFANRKALRVVAERFGAVPPRKPGAPPTCRQCGAPLRSADAVVVRCVYCGAENVLGVDPRPAAQRRRGEKLDLASALRHRRRARWRLALTLPMCAVFGAVVFQQAAVLWWIPPSDATPWMSGPTKTITSDSALPRTVSFTSESGVARATILRGGAISWSCTGECVVGR